ncbi:MAG TPA: cbb3-type cytochrome c oxidase subunit 3 [bacterium]
MSLFKQLQMAIDLGPTLVTVLFVALFVGTLVWICRPGSRKYYDNQAQLPLEDGAPRAVQLSALERRNG